MDMKSNASQDLGLKINLCVCIFSDLWSGCQPGPVLLFVPKWGCIHIDTYLRLPFFLWRFSGITRKTLENVTATLDDVQKCLIDLLPHDAILIGHSLENDLRALKVSSFHSLVPAVNCCPAFCIIANYTSAEELRKPVCHLCFFLFAC